MKLFQEGLENGAIVPEIPFNLVYGGGLRRFGIAYLEDFSKYSKEARQELIEYIISVDREDICSTYLDDIYCAMCAWVGNLMFFDVRGFDETQRMALVREMLLWKKWGVSGIDEALYKTAFRLIYYDKMEPFSFSMNAFERYPAGWRKVIVKGMLATHQNQELERFICFALSDLKCFSHYRRAQRRSIQMILFKEVARWQNWGMDLSFCEKELEHTLSAFIFSQDAVGFGTFIKSTGLKIDKVLEKALMKIVNQSEFKKQHTKKMFLDSINKNLLA